MRHTILVIEDEPDLMLAFRILLEATGHDVVEAASGEAAIDVLVHVSPDVIVLDIMLPGIDGWEVLERLRRSGTARGVPVIVASANASLEQERRVAEFGCAALLTKPFDANELCRTIDRLLRETA